MDIYKCFESGKALPLQREKIINYINLALQADLALLILILPVAHTATLRWTSIILAFGLWGVKVLLNQKEKFVRSPIDLPILIFFIFAALSFFTSVKPSSTFTALRGEVITVFLLFHLVLNNIKKEEEVKRLFYILCLGSVIMSGYGILDFIQKGGSLIDIRVRAGSLHNGFGAFSQYLITVIPFLMVRIGYSLRRKSLVFWGFLIGINLFALYITYTRGAWIAFFVEVVLISLLIPRRKLVFASLALALIIFALILPASVKIHGKGGISMAPAQALGDTINMRLLTWKASFIEIKDNPFRGFGLGIMNLTSKFRNPLDFPVDAHAHNTFINLTLQLGIQGLLAFLLLIYCLLRANWRGLRKAKGEFAQFFGISAFVMVIGFFVGSLFVDFYGDDAGMLFWLINGMNLSLINMETKSETDGIPKG